MDLENNTPEMDEELDNIITLNDEDGNEVKFEFLDLIEYGGEEYVILLPAEEGEDADEVVILKVEDTGSEEEESYVSVDDEEILNSVFDIFKEKNFYETEIFKISKEIADNIENLTNEEFINEIVNKFNIIENCNKSN